MYLVGTFSFTFVYYIAILNTDLGQPEALFCKIYERSYSECEEGQGHLNQNSSFLQNAKAAHSN